MDSRSNRTRLKRTLYAGDSLALTGEADIKLDRQAVVTLRTPAATLEGMEFAVSVKDEPSIVSVDRKVIALIEAPRETRHIHVDKSRTNHLIKQHADVAKIVQIALQSKT